MNASELSEKIAQAYKKGKITGNQARSLCGLPPIQGLGMDVLVQVDDKAMDRAVQPVNVVSSDEA